jgi:aquaporin Z
MAKYLVEFIGTFFLVATVGFTVTAGHPLAALAIGAALMVMIFAGGHISGGHYNPAVTLAVYLRGRCPLGDVLPYMAAQVLAAVLAALVVMYLKDVAPNYPGSGSAGAAIPKIFLAEFLFTFALCYVVLNVATAKGTSGNSFYGLAIGFTVFAGVCAVGTIPGAAAAFNPAVAVGVTVMGLSAVANIWILLLGEVAGAVAAAFAFRYINPGDK